MMFLLDRGLFLGFSLFNAFLVESWWGIQIAIRRSCAQCIFRGCWSIDFTAGIVGVFRHINFLNWLVSDPHVFPSTKGLAAQPPFAEIDRQRRSLLDLPISIFLHQVGMKLLHHLFASIDIQLFNIIIDHLQHGSYRWLFPPRLRMIKPHILFFMLYNCLILIEIQAAVFLSVDHGNEKTFVDDCFLEKFEFTWWADVQRGCSWTWHDRIAL